MRAFPQAKTSDRPIRLPSDVNFVPQDWADRYQEKLCRCRADRRARFGEQLVLQLNASGRC